VLHCNIQPIALRTLPLRFTQSDKKGINCFLLIVKYWKSSAFALLDITKWELLQLRFEASEIVGLDDGGSLAAMTLDWELTL
jgi:hypothetical protein